MAGLCDGTYVLRGVVDDERILARVKVYASTFGIMLCVPDEAAGLGGDGLIDG